MSTTDDEADLFFQRGARSRPGLNGTTAADESTGSADSSSDIEVVGHSSAAKPTPKNAKGKGKAVVNAGPSIRKGKGRLADQTAAGSSSAARKTRRTAVRISSSSSDSSSDEHRAPTSGQGLPFTATQLVRDGAGLRARAREKGWQGSTPPPRAKRTTAAASRKATVAADDTDSDSDLSDLGGPRRRISTSTDQTTVSDRSSSSLTKRKGDTSAATTKAAPARKRAPAASTSSKVKEPSAPKPRKRRTSRVTTMSPSPDADEAFDPALQPPPPQSFWGVDASASTSAAAAKKHKHGEATNRLKSLSERAKMLVLPEEDDAMIQDEIDLADSGCSSAGEPEKYELAAAKAKRQKAEALELLKAKRGRVSDEMPPRKSTPRADSVEAAPPDTGKQRAVAGPATRACPVCAEKFPLADLDRHANDCLDFTGMEDYQPTAAQPQAGPSIASLAESAFRPAGAAASVTTFSTASKSTAAKNDNLAAALFPSSPAGQRPARSATSNVRQPPAVGRPADHDFEDEVVATSPGKKGKGRAVDHRPDGYLSSSDDLYETRGQAAGAAAQRSFIEIRDDEDDVIIEDGGGSNNNRRAAGSSRRTDGREGSINSAFNAGPPDDGSSPPRASLYISTMSHAFREGYQRMYARPEPKAKKARTSTGSTSSNGARQYDPDLSDSEARAYDDLAPGPSRRSGGSGRGRGGSGGGGKRGGGARRGSWSWKRGRGRGAKKS